MRIRCIDLSRNKRSIGNNLKASERPFKIFPV